MDQPTKTIDTQSYKIALPYLSLLPLNQQCLDTSVFNKVEEDTNLRILEYLLGEGPQEDLWIKLSSTDKQDKDKTALTRALQSSLVDFKSGKATLSLGYPMVVVIDEQLDKAVAAPLFVWEIDLIQSIEETNDWKIDLANTNGKVNGILKSYLRTKLDLDWEQEIGLINDISSETVVQTVEKIAPALGIDSEEKAVIYPFELAPCPSPYAALQTAILPNLILGNLLPGAVTTTTAKTKEKLPTPIVGRTPIKWQTKVPALPSNAEQNELIGTIFEGHHVVAEGAKGTGKTHTIANLLASVLVDGGNALIVSPQEESTNEIIYHLDKLGLSNIAAIRFFEEDLDKLKLIKRLAKLPELIQNIKLLDSTDYSKKLNKHQLLRSKIEQTYDSLYRPAFGDWTWTNLVGEFLKHHQKAPKQLLSRKLDKKHYNFNQEELDIICEEIAEHYQKYSQINILTHGLNALHSQFFGIDTTVDTSREAASAAINLCHHKTTKVYHNYIEWIDNYATVQKIERIDFSNQLQQQLDKIINDLHLYEDLYGNDFDKQSTLQNAKLKLLSLFSRKHQEIITAKQQLLVDYEQLHQIYEQQSYFRADFPNIQKESKLADIETKLEQFRNKLKDWTNNIESTIDNQIKELDNDSTLPNEVLIQKEKLEKSLQGLLVFINETKILKEELVYQSNGVHADSAFLYKVSMQFQKLENLWKDFDAYFHWRKSWLSVSKETQKAVQALIHANATQWVDSFRSWYLYQVLLEVYDATLPQSDFQTALPYQAYQNNLPDVQQKIAEKAIRITYERQTSEIRRIKKEKDITLTNAAPLFKNKSLKDIIDWLGVAHFGELFPVVIMSPAIAKNVFGNNKTPLFNLIITDDSQVLPEEEGVQLLKLANQRVVLGEIKQHNDNSSLLNWMMNQSGRRYQYLREVQIKDETPITQPSEVTVPKINAYQQAIAAYLAPYIDKDRIKFNTIWSDVAIVLDIMIVAKSDSQPPFAIITEGGLLLQSKYDFESALERINFLESSNIQTAFVWSAEWFKHPQTAFEQLLATVLDWDKQGETK